MADFILQVPVSISGDEKDFYNELVALNEGQAVQELAGGKIRDFANITDQQKKDFALKQIGQTFSNVYENSKLESEVQAFRLQKQAEREAAKQPK